MQMKMLLVFLAAFLVTSVAKQAVILEYVHDKAWIGDQRFMISKKVSSGIHCVQKCLREEDCYTVNYQKDGPDCQLFKTPHDSTALEDSKAESIEKRGWVAVLIKVNKFLTEI